MVVAGAPIRSLLLARDGRHGDVLFGFIPRIAVEANPSQQDQDHQHETCDNEAAEVA